LGLGAERRLTRREDFERLLRDGTRRSIHGYTLYVARRDGGPPRLGILVTRKHAARATERNSLKRCIREAFRLEQEAIGGLDLLVRPPQRARAGTRMIAQLREIFSRLER
jgi:ribonuclease P protein component